MLTLKEACVVALLAVLTLCVAASDNLDTGYEPMRYRSTGTDQDVVPKPVRDDGLGSLLLKNLRFRDLDQAYEGRPLSNALLWDLHKMKERSENSRDAGQETERKVEKRQRSVSVSQLAELLHSLKTRGIDDSGVKLQSLRFGK